MARITIPAPKPAAPAAPEISNTSLESRPDDENPMLEVAVDMHKWAYPIERVLEAFGVETSEKSQSLSNRHG